VIVADFAERMAAVGVDLVTSGPRTGSGGPGDGISRLKPPAAGMVDDAERF
jgi:hypothetical protein